MFFKFLNAMLNGVHVEFNDILDTRIIFIASGISTFQDQNVFSHLILVIF